MTNSPPAQAGVLAEGAGTSRPELIILERLNRLPYYVCMQQKSPIEQDQVQAWAAFYGATKVYYWPKTLSAFIIKEVVK
jgi:hypothetical protein